MNHWLKISAYFFSTVCYAQTVDGVYVGEILSSGKNALVISTVGATVIGHVYINQNKKYSFFGSCSDQTLEGTVFLESDKRNILGNFNGDSLSGKIQLLSGNLDSKSISLIRISKNPKYNLNKIFEPERPAFSTQLLGQWRLVKKVNSGGKPVNFDNLKYEFKPLGTLLMYSNSAKVTALKKELGIKSSFMPTAKWETRDNKLDLIFGAPNIQTVTNEYEFEIKGDTLILTRIMLGLKSYYKAEKLLPAIK